MSAATAETKHALALQLFAGIRPEEISGLGKPPLDWRHIDRKEKTIYVPPECSKIHSRPRLLEHKLPENLWKWLKDGKKEGVVSAIARETLQRHAKQLPALPASRGRMMRCGTRSRLITSQLSATSPPPRSF